MGRRILPGFLASWLTINCAAYELYSFEAMLPACYTTDLPVSPQTLEQNITFGLRMRHMAKYEIHRYPFQLSGANSDYKTLCFVDG